MPGGCGIGFAQANFSDHGTNAATSLGTTVTASGSINTKGSWVQLNAATAYDMNMFWIFLENPSVNNSGYLIDIGIGAAASEIVLIANIPYGCPSNSSGIIGIPCPVAIPAGTRISARIQGATASCTISAQVVGCDGMADEPAGLGAPKTYGALTASSQGTLIDPGGTANTKGSYAQITASTTYDIGAVAIIIDNQQTLCAGSLLFDLAVGAAASEKIVLGNIPITIGNGNVGSSGGFYGNPVSFKRCKIPAGTRLSLRAQSSNNGAGSRKFGATVIGFQL